MKGTREYQQPKWPFIVSRPRHDFVVWPTRTQYQNLAQWFQSPCRSAIKDTSFFERIQRKARLPSHLKG